MTQNHVSFKKRSRSSSHVYEQPPESREEPHASPRSPVSLEPADEEQQKVRRLGTQDEPIEEFPTWRQLSHSASSVLEERIEHTEPTSRTEEASPPVNLRKRSSMADAQEVPTGTTDATKRARTGTEPAATVAADNTPRLVRQARLATWGGVKEVRVVPGLRLADDKISELSMGQRTPSPFTGREGDHTTAWAMLVDSVTASLYGKSIPEAVAAVRALQQRADGWMDKGSGTLQAALFDALPDSEKRGNSLGDAAFRVNAFCDQAAAATDPAVAQAALQKAIAQHLAYRNYLPFATVPAESIRGSHGNSEGNSRRILLEHENGTLHTPTELTETAWKLFDFTAALRAAGVEAIVAPSALSTLNAAHDEVTALHQKVVALLGRMSADGRPPALEAVSALLDAANALRARKIDGVFSFAGSLRDTLMSLDQAVHLTATQRKTRSRKDIIALATKKVMADAIVEQVRGEAATATETAPKILAALLHDHQQTLATGYPASVATAGLVGDGTQAGAAQVATARLEVAIKKAYSAAFVTNPTAEGTAPLATLLAAIQAHYASDDLRAIPVPTGRGTWAANAVRRQIVTTFTEGELRVDGRTPAPSGISGMGSHTTAWTLEVAHAQKLVSGKIPADAVAALKAAVRRDLGIRPEGAVGDVDPADTAVLELGSLLPADQLDGGQLLTVFDQAQNVLDAAPEDVAAAAASYLTFRNFLPFATVNDGSRDGKGEGSGKTSGQNFDGDSLRLAADSKADELVKQTSRVAKALTDAATDLELSLSRSKPFIDVASAGDLSQAPPLDLVGDGGTGTDTDEEQPRWDDSVEAVVERTLGQLRATAVLIHPGVALSDAAAKFLSGAAGTIYKTRDAEHKRVYEEATGKTDSPDARAETSGDPDY